MAECSPGSFEHASRGHARTGKFWRLWSRRSTTKHTPVDSCGLAHPRASIIVGLVTLVGSPMRIVNVRLLHACNSSSTHTMLIGHQRQGGDYLYDKSGEFGWQNFELCTSAAKANYFGQILLHAFRQSLGNEAGLEVVRSLLPDLPEGHIDHQSMPQMPSAWGAGKEVDMGYARALEAFLQRPDVIVLGGNDDDDVGHGYGDPGVGLPFRDCFSRVRARQDSEHVWTLYNAESGARVTVDFSAKSTDGLYTPWENLDVKFPWLVDLKITNKCSWGCAFCYQGSVPGGAEASLEDVFTVAKSLRDGRCFEVAIGGGEPTEHPNFLAILRAFSRVGVTPNFTTRDVTWVQSHVQELNDVGVRAVAVSVDNQDQAACLAAAMGGMPNREFQVHAQIIDGITSDVCKVREALDVAGVEVTLLGYKSINRGSLVKPPHLGAWRADPQVQEFGKGEYWRFPYAVDTAFLSQYADDPILKNVRPETKDIVEGRTSMYIDLVTHTAARSSYDGYPVMLQAEDVASAWRAVRV